VDVSEWLVEMSRIVLGVDVSATDIRAAPVDVIAGELVSKALSTATPLPGTPHQIMATICEFADRIAWDRAIGIGFPGVVQDNVIRKAFHLGPDWIDVDLAAVITSELGEPVSMINDADAAGLAEVNFGAGFGHRGVVVMVTLGTHVGSSVFVDGTLLPNTELGSLRLCDAKIDSEVGDHVCGRPAADDDSSWSNWAGVLNGYLNPLEELFWPQLIIVGGSTSVEFPRFEHFLDIETPVMAATKGHDGVIIGAALNALRVV
jgi:polyphosphate glucokinase